MADSGRIDTTRWARPPARGGTVGILVGGGPAPGINGVISAITIEARNHGCRVVGILDGYRWLSEGKTDQVQELAIETVSQIHLAGGSILGTSRANPTADPAKMERVLAALQSLGVGMLASIGGDDTAYTASQVAKRAAGRVRVVHVPKTIDNDLPLPEDMPTFGFQTARHEGVRVLRNLAVDAKSTRRWYLAVTMGRKAGHLALGIGKAAGATLTLIPEEFRERTPLKVVGDLIETTILKRRVMGRAHGTVVIGEGLVEKLAPEELRGLDRVGHDEHGHLRLSDVPLGEILRREIVARFALRGEKLGMVTKDIGYELRCADPIPLDLEYTRDLGWGAIRFLLEGGSGAMMSVQKGDPVPIPFDRILDRETGRTAVRLVNLQTQSYRVAREYMIRLEKADLEDPERAERLARAMNLPPAELVTRFRYLVEDNPWLVPLAPSPAIA